MYKDQQEIKEAMLRGELHWKVALELITAKKSKPWTSAAWKKMREEKIGTACVQCGTTEGPLVLQHTWHPRPLKVLWQEAQRSLRDAYYQDHPIVRTEQKPVDRQACPRCQSTSIRQVKQSGRWQCNGKKRGRVCGHEFDAPILVKGFSPQQKHTRGDEWRQLQQEQYEGWLALCAQHEDELGLQVVVMSIDEHLRYMSGEDTVTMCKRCAFIADKRLMLF